MHKQEPCCSSRLAVNPLHSCSHLKAFKENGGLNDFHIIQHFLQTYQLMPQQSIVPPVQCLTCADMSNVDVPASKRQKTTHAPNGTAATHSLQGEAFGTILGSNIDGARLHVCLQCVFIGCKTRGHIHAHFKQNEHFLAVDVSHNQIYCNQCGDYVYDTDLELAVGMEKTNVTVARQHLYDSKRGIDIKNKVLYNEWLPTKKESENLKKYSKTHFIPPHLLGLRGLTNLGNTCFMNSILQCFLHNPLLRNYFLSDMHNSKYCTQRSQDDKKSVCLGCEMDFLFTQIFSGVRTPYTPHHFLYSIWRYANSFAGYEQQDAHEFLITALNGIHSHCNGKSKDCRCIIHKIFSGILRSEVKCKCGHVSTSYDPFLDISLDLRKKGTEAESNDSLFECLDRYTKPERLGSEEKFLCSKCNTYQETIKQLSIQVMPIVFCFHIKRFEVDTFVAFPEVLDMSPYHSSNITKERGKQVDGETSASLNNLEQSNTFQSHLYHLFAVVHHYGKMDAGHYICYVKHSNSWFKCDDAWITKASLHHVLATKGYLLFYMRKNLEYSKNAPI